MLDSRPAILNGPAMAQAEQARAWTTYWRQWGGEAACCIPSAPPGLNRLLDAHWTSFARRLGDSRKILDLACGAGAVAHVLVREHPTLQVIGVDSAQVPAASADRVSLLSGMRLESMPFADHSFDGAVSQYGVEYADVPKAARELARVLKPSAPIDFLVHHAGGPIAQHNRRRNSALGALAAPGLASTFLTGDREAMVRQFAQLGHDHPGQDVIDEFASGLGQALNCSADERQQIWAGLCAKLGAERAILDALESAAVLDVGEWARQFAPWFEVDQTTSLADERGEPIAWAISGVRRALPSR